MTRRSGFATSKPRFFNASAARDTPSDGGLYAPRTQDTTRPAWARRRIDRGGTRCCSKEQACSSRRAAAGRDPRQSVGLAGGGRRVHACFRSHQDAGQCRRAGPACQRSPAWERRGRAMAAFSRRRLYPMPPGEVRWPALSCPRRAPIICPRWGSGRLQGASDRGGRPRGLTRPTEEGVIMSWIEHHENSERLASQAQVVAQEGRWDEARALYARAADVEESAIADLDRSKVHTLGISAVSAASLHYKANELARAGAVAARWLRFEGLPAFARDQLRLLLHACRNQGPGGEPCGSGSSAGLPAHVPEADP